MWKLCLGRRSGERDGPTLVRMTFLKDCTRFVNSLNVQAEVSDERWNNVVEYILRLLQNRLRFAEDLSRNPEILDQELLPPVLIVSLPRTGSTKLHRMLGVSGSFQVLPFLAAIYVCSYSGDGKRG